jgi:predicted GIY-YIG superfamily endonuclease
MSNRKNGTLYTGVSGRFLHRIVQRRDGLVEGVIRGGRCAWVAGTSPAMTEERKKRK